MTTPRTTSDPDNPSTGPGRHWFVWLLVAGLLGLAALGWAISSATVIAFMVVPIVASTALGRPLVTLTLTVLAIALSLLPVALRDSETALIAAPVAGVALTGVTAAAIAALLQRRQILSTKRLGELEASERRFRLLTDHSADLLALTDAQGRFTYLSPAVETLVGYTADELLGLHWSELLEQSDVDTVTDVVDAAEDLPGRAGHVLTHSRRKDGSRVWVSSLVTAVADWDGGPAGLVATCRDVTGEIEARQELRHRAQFDDLTAVLNRSEGLSRLGLATSRPRSPGDHAAILFIDVDDFKGVNDHNGHAAGDEALRTLTRRMTGAVRTGDTVARIGGDEFLILLDGLHDRREAVRIAEKLLSASREPVLTPAGPVTSTVSIGVAELLPEQDADSLLATADAAMYEAKAEGGDRVVVIQADRESVDGTDVRTFS